MMHRKGETKIKKMAETSSHISLISKTRNKLDLQFKRLSEKQMGKKNKSMMFSQNTFIRTERLKEGEKIYSCQIQLGRLLDSQLIIKQNRL